MFNKKTIEHFGLFGLNAGNTTNTTTNNTYKTLTDTTKNIDRSMVIDAVAETLKSVVNNLSSSNQADLQQLIVISNEINVNGANAGGDFNLTNVNMNNKVDLTTKMNSAQSITTKISTELTNNFTENISKQVTDMETIGKSSSVSDAINAVTDLGKEFIGKTADVLKGSALISAGNNTNTTTITDTENTLKTAFNLNDSFKLNQDKSFSDSVSNILKSDNINSCLTNLSNANEINLDAISAKGNINLDKINLNNEITQVMECAFNQTIVNDLANKFVTNFENLIENMSNNTKTDNQGDILAVGTAGATVLIAGGDAVSTSAKGIGTGVGTAATGVGTGVGTAATGVGTGVANAATGIGAGLASAWLPLSIGYVILMIAIYFLFFN
jgi:hypothetical protein